MMWFKKRFKICQNLFKSEHNFGRWEKFEEGNIINSVSKEIQGSFVRQKRICQDCHFIEFSQTNISFGKIEVHVSEG